MQYIDEVITWAQHYTKVLGATEQRLKGMPRDYAWELESFRFFLWHRLEGCDRGSSIARQVRYVEDEEPKWRSQTIDELEEKCSPEPILKHHPPGWTGNLITAEDVWNLNQILRGMFEECEEVEEVRHMKRTWPDEGWEDLPVMELGEKTLAAEFICGYYTGRGQGLDREKDDLYYYKHKRLMWRKVMRCHLGISLFEMGKELIEGDLKYRWYNCVMHWLNEDSVDEKVLASRLVLDDSRGFYFCYTPSRPSTDWPGKPSW
jgi:hypothetical protein